MEAPPVCRVALNMCAPPLYRADEQEHCYFAAVLISENGQGSPAVMRRQQVRQSNRASTTPALVETVRR